jgi:hypothetical protein
MGSAPMQTEQSGHGRCVPYQAASVSVKQLVRVLVVGLRHGPCARFVIAHIKSLSRPEISVKWLAGHDGLHDGHYLLRTASSSG